jgi:uncharacterized protein YodC (DUF2158 family)
VSELDIVPFKVGDLVRLRNPWGPVMTVSCIDHDALALHVVWFGADSALHQDSLPMYVLEMVPAT